MEETVYEWMERIGLVDHLLATIALVVPLAAGACWWTLRRRPFLARRRPELVMLIVAPPVLWVLWKVYNAVMDHYGLDSVFALFLNAVIFIGAGTLLAWIYRRA
jgi:hypothetical protein